MRIYIDPLYKKKGSNWLTHDIHDLDWINKDEYQVIEEIHFDAVDIDKIDFSPLFTLNNLRRISIRCHDDSFTFFPNLSGIKNLKELEIFDSNISSFDNIRKNVPDIEKMYICNDNKIVSLKGLSEINSLKELFLNDTDNDYNFLDLYGLSNLESFKAFTTGFIDFNGIEKLTSLKLVDVYRCKPKNISYLDSAKTLQTLNLGIDNGVKDIKFLENLDNLEDLSLYNDYYNPYSDGKNDKKEDYQIEIDITPITKLIKLNNLQFAGCAVNNIEALNELPKLKSAWFIDCFIHPDNDRDRIKGNIRVMTDFTGDH